LKTLVLVYGYAGSDVFAQPSGSAAKEQAHATLMSCGSLTKALRGHRMAPINEMYDALKLISMKRHNVRSGELPDLLFNNRIVLS